MTSLKSRFLKKLLISFASLLSTITTLGLESALSQTITPTATSTPAMICCLQASPWTAPTVTAAWGVGVDTSRGRVYVTDSQAGLVLALDYAGTPVTAFGGGSAAVSGAFAVAVGQGAYDGVYIMNRIPTSGSTTITKLNPDGSFSWGVSTAPAAGYGRYLCLDDWGNLYMTSGGIFPICVMDSAGNPKAIIPDAGSFGSLNAPTGVVMVGLNLFVADSSNNRVVQYAESGVNTYSYTATRAVTLTYPPIGLATDLTGHIYVSIGNGYAVFDSQFNQLTQWCALSQLSGGFGIALDETGAVYEAANAVTNVLKMQACFPQLTFTPTPSYTPTVTFTPTPSFTPTITLTPSPPPAAHGDSYIYPSPARGGRATLSYNMAESGTLDLQLWNQNGERISEITDRKPAGPQATSFSLTGFAPGIYYYLATLNYDSGMSERLKMEKFAVIR